MDADRIVIAEAEPADLDVPTRNVAAMLYTIAECEGVPRGRDGYFVLFGWPAPGRTFTSIADHPRVKFPFTQTDGTVNYSSAAGRYQIIAPSWDAMRARIRLPNFAPEHQDEWATQTITDQGALDDVRRGDLRAAIDKLSSIWASLPASKYMQPKRSYEFAANAFEEGGGVLA